MVNLTIGGGNIKGIGYIGALEYLYENNLLNKIDNFYGSSVGTIIGIFFIIGFKPFEIFEILLNINFEKYWDLNLNNLEKTYSLISDTFFKKIKEIFTLKENGDITFLNFYKKYNVKIYLFATSLTQRKNICFNMDNYPDLKVLTVLQASCSIPLIFPPVKINNELFIDGCVKSIDGIYKNIIENDKNIHFVIKGNYSNTKINSFMDYINQIINCAIQNENEFETEYTINIISNNEYENKYNFGDIKYNDKIKFFYEGLFQAKEKMHDNIFNIKLNLNSSIIN